MTANRTADLKLAIWLRWDRQSHPRIYNYIFSKTSDRARARSIHHALQLVRILVVSSLPTGPHCHWRSASFGPQLPVGRSAGPQFTTAPCRQHLPSDAARYSRDLDNTQRLKIKLHITASSRKIIDLRAIRKKLTKRRDSKHTQKFHFW